MSPEAVAQEFNACINRADLAGLGALMTDDHVFVDSEGADVSGKAACLDAWRGFFRAFPDYRNTFTQLRARGERVVIVGYSTCSVAVLDGPAPWTADVADAKVRCWRVYHDTPALRAALAIA